MAATTFWRRGYVSLKSLIPAIVLTFAGSLIGALIVKRIDVSLLEIAVPIALIGIALTLRVGTEGTLKLEHQVHVDNTP